MEFPGLVRVVAVSLIKTKASYRRLHVIYFAVFSILGTLSLWLIPKPAGYPGFSFTDALFCAVSALTVTGLSTVEMHNFSISDLVTILILMIVGSQVFTSAIPLFIRRILYDPNPAALDAAMHRANSVSSLPSMISIDEKKSMDHEPQPPPEHTNNTATNNINHNTSNGSITATDNINNANGSNGSLDRSSLSTRSVLEIRRRESAVVDIDSAAAAAEAGFATANYNANNNNIRRKRGVSMPVLPTMKAASRGASWAALPALPTVKARLLSFIKGSNYQEAADESKNNRIMVDYEEEKERLKKEAGALRALSWIVLAYWLTFQTLGLIVVLSCIAGSRHDTSLLRQRGVNRGFFSYFTTASSFANAGYMPVDDSLVALNGNSPLLIWVMILILAGNTLYAPSLRFIIWLTWKLTPSTWRQLRESLHYLLTRPRRCYTHLFPTTETLWLVFMAAVFNAVQFAVISGIDWRTGVFDGLSGFAKVINALFSSVTTRNAGFNVVNTGSFSASTLLFAVGMMYVAVYPVYLSRQHSKETIFPNDESPTKPKEEIYMQCRNLFARDSVYVFTAIFLVCIFERHAITNDPLNFSVFNIIFEIISGYGNVGLSVGYSCSLNLYGASTCVDVACSFAESGVLWGNLWLSS